MLEWHNPNNRCYCCSQYESTFRSDPTRLDPTLLGGQHLMRFENAIPRIPNAKAGSSSLLCLHVAPRFTVFELSLPLQRRTSRLISMSMMLVVCSFSITSSPLHAQLIPAAFVEPVVSPLVDDPAAMPLTGYRNDGAPNASKTEDAIEKRIYSSDEIAQLAARNASLAILMRGDLQADRTGVFRPSKKQQAILNLRSKIQEFRIARQTQLAASQALELHFALATIASLEPLQNELRGLLKLQRERQERAIERGISISDPTAIDRLLSTTQDTQLQSQSKAAQLRSQLALLVDPSIACHYVPEPMNVPESTTTENCKMIEWAMCQRCDLAGLIYLRSHLNEETLDVARWMSDVLSGSVTLAAGFSSRPLSLLGIVSSKQKQAQQEELCERLNMLDEAIKSLRAKIASEVDIALNKQSTAYSRFTNTQAHVDLWQHRVAQLRSYGEQVKAQPAEMLEAELQVLQAKSELVQRQGDWHQAIVELALAVGCIP